MTGERKKTDWTGSAAAAGQPIEGLLAEIRACRVCAAHLPHGPRPVLQAGPRARLLVIGQAPGRAVHASGVPWDDKSGDRLRDWLGLTPDVFYDVTRVALVGMGFCYPGSGPHGDLPPRPECAPRWHDRLLPHLRSPLRILIGAHAISRYDPLAGSSVTEAVRSWRGRPASVLVLPHPSPRNNGWLAANPWFEEELLPIVRDRVARALAVPAPAGPRARAGGTGRRNR